ncbi:hypothetical protein K505DRAFT_298745 [Melanomma pulvis-pyrius CBS 109.77]|uniref:Calcium-dependent phosphotriesterase n=1 Tax=Melanomma pulvis-pyrius CBS 109.77 TaxID=1314802 RepID=A0A6A6XLW8_9PLEO|nr:hypothetical protein K505DRAFT_298745 [Melanomma pulvis-pyrius CBS 109.77]
MARSKNLAIAVALLGAFYQWWAKEFFFAILGIGRAVEPIENFPYSCRRLVDKQLEGCEDLWLDEDGRVLYAACSGSIARTQWNQGMSKLNVSGRRSEGSQLIALYIDEFTKDGQFRMHNIAPKNYGGATGDGTLDLIGFDAVRKSIASLQFWLINQRPPVDEFGKFRNAPKVGDNVTVDVFEYVKGAESMNHVKTVADPSIYSANGIALIGEEAFVLTNDHSGKVGLRKELDIFIGGGNVVHCIPQGSCQPVTHNSLKFANGLTRGHDGLIYVPLAAQTFISVYRFEQSGKLNEVDRIEVGMPIDNLSVDSNGDIWAAGMTKMLEVMAVMGDPLNRLSTSTVFLIHKTEDGVYETTKVLEDGEKKALSGASTVVHDVRTGRLFVGGIATPFISVCEPI